MRILIAEDEAVSCRLLESLITKWGYESVVTTNGKEALRILKSEDSPQIAILDWMMPIISGVDVCREVRKIEKESYTYMLLLSAKHQKEDIIDGLKAGADDYIVKPFNADELEMRIRAAKRIIELENNLRNMSIKDELTGLYNRRGFFALFEHHMKLAKRQKIKYLLLYADIDNLKDINDTLGHQEGDLVLIETAKILKETYRESDIIARIGGDEFAVFPVGTSEDNKEIISSRLQKNIDIYNAEREQIYNLSISVGIASYDPKFTDSVDKSLAHADKLMYEQKNQKKLS